jgi:hypothetical protein
MDNHDAKALTGKPGLQIDISQTAFSSAGALRSLIQAVSYDDVQPQAVLAAEALGFGLLVSPMRINEAVNALDGNESVKWDKFKIVLGLQSKGIVKAIRNSTALTQFFLVATAFKLCYTDTELGDVFFEMISHSGVLNLFPVASSQLARLVDAFSGYCDRIIPIDFMHSLAVAVDKCSANHAFYQRLDNTRLTVLIWKIFENLRDATVEYVSLTGCYSGCSLATIFSWLLPEKTAIIVEDQVIIAVNQAKLTIHLTKSHRDQFGYRKDWQIQAWRSEGGPTTFVSKDQDEAQPQNISELPLKLSKSFFHHSYHVPSKPTNEERSKATEAIGALAGALVTYVTENGHIYVSKSCCSGPSLGKSPCSRVQLLSLQKEEWIESYTRAAAPYGWDIDDSSLKPQASALEVIKSIFLADTHQRDIIPIAQQVVAFRERLMDWADTKLGTLDPYLRELIVEGAIKISVHALASSLCNIETGNLKMGFSAHSPLGRRTGSDEEFIIRLLSRTGLDVGQLKLSVLGCVFPYSSLNLQDLAISQDGLVAGWSVLWEQTTLQRACLQLKVLRGTIQRQGFRYRRILEPSAGGWVTLDGCHGKVPVNLFQGETYSGIQVEQESRHLSTKFVCTEVGDTLEVKTFLCCRDKFGEEYSQLVYWISAQSYLAGATHVERPNTMSRLQEESVALALHNKPLEAYWVSPCHNSDAGPKREGNIVLRTVANEELRFWIAAALSERGTDKCVVLVVRHSGPLISSLFVAAQKNETWALLL